MTSKLFDEIHWIIVQSLKAVAVSDRRVGRGRPGGPWKPNGRPWANQQFSESVAQLGVLLVSQPCPCISQGLRVWGRDWGWFLGQHCPGGAWSASDRATDLDSSAEV